MKKTSQWRPVSGIRRPRSGERCLEFGDLTSKAGVWDSVKCDYDRLKSSFEEWCLEFFPDYSRSSIAIRCLEFRCRLSHSVFVSALLLSLHVFKCSFPFSLLAPGVISGQCNGRAVVGCRFRLVRGGTDS
jgi:hypothetical protein